MCLAFILVDAHPLYPLLIASNRDEFYARPALPAAPFDDAPILAGRDGTRGGTWLGVGTLSIRRVAIVTNARWPTSAEGSADGAASAADGTTPLPATAPPSAAAADLGGPAPPAPRSRGQLVTNFLLGRCSPLEYLRSLEPHAGEYGGFNLIVAEVVEPTQDDGAAPVERAADAGACAPCRGRGSEAEAVAAARSGREPEDSESRPAPRPGSCLAAYFSNCSGEPPRPLAPGLYALSNALLDTPWPKVVRARARLRHVLDAAGEGPVDAGRIIDEVLGNAELTVPGDALSAAFVSVPSAPGGGYGTRSCTVLTLTRGGTALLRERARGEDGVWEEREIVAGSGGGPCTCRVLPRPMHANKPQLFNQA